MSPVATGNGVAAGGLSRMSASQQQWQQQQQQQQAMSSRAAFGALVRSYIASGCSPYRAEQMAADQMAMAQAGAGMQQQTAQRQPSQQQQHSQAEYDALVRGLIANGCSPYRAEHMAAAQMIGGA